jgi:hypothetical protein
LKREEAIFVLKELLDACNGLDGHYLELSNPCASIEAVGGYQIVIHATLDKKTKEQIQKILAKHGLSCQEGTLWKTKRSKTEADTFIIYKDNVKNPK